VTFFKHGFLGFCCAVFGISGRVFKKGFRKMLVNFALQSSSEREKYAKIWG